MASFEEMFERLNEAQQQAVLHIDGPMMVLAGAGTGKTQVIAMRIANLLREGVEPYTILCLTFTESGVAAMRERLVQILGVAGYYVKVHTFHSFCNEVIGEHPERFVFARELQSLSELEQMQWMAELLDARDVSDALKTYGDPYFYRREILGAISTLKRERVNPERFKEMVEANKEFVEEVGELLKEFKELDARSVNEQKIESFKLYIVDKLQISNHTNQNNNQEPIINHQTMTNDQLSIGNENYREDVEFLYRALLTVVEQAKVECELNPGKRGVSYKGVRDAVKRFYERLDGQLAKQQSLEQFYVAYEAKLRQMGRYDFDDMILMVLQELDRDTVLRAEYQERYQYILIDEFQDTNTAQNSVADLFAKNVDLPNIFVVGDDDQAIYRFQGANLENVLGFYQRHTDSLQLVTLIDNYRSQQLILDAAGQVIEHNVYRAQVHLPQISKALRAAKVNEEKHLELVHFARYEDELVWVARQLKQLVAEGVPPEELAVLMRKNAQCDEIVSYLVAEEVPYVLERGENVFDVLLVRQFRLLLQVIDQPYDEVAWFGLLRASFLQLDTEDVLKLQLALSKKAETVEDKKKRTLDAMRDVNGLAENGIKEAERLKSLADRVLEWHQKQGEKDTMGLIEMVFVDSGLMVFAEAKSEGLVWLSAFKSLLDAIRGFLTVERHGSLADVLHFLQEHEVHGLAIMFHVSRTDGSGVRVMTAHKSKGLEFRYVFLPQCTDRMWGASLTREMIKLPLQMVKYDPSVLAKEAIEDERRLFYVALTRGKQEVCLSFAQKAQDGKEQLPSRFLQEMNSRVLEEVDRTDFAAPTLVLKSDRKREFRLQNDLVQKRLSELKLSATNLNDYLHCPRLFYYRHFLKAPMMKSKQLALGTATHEALEALYRSVSSGLDDLNFEAYARNERNNQDPNINNQLSNTNNIGKVRRILSKEEMLSVFEKVLWREILNEKDFKDSLEQGRLFLGAYYDHYSEKLVQPLEIEYNFEWEHVVWEEIPLTGKVDMMVLTDRLARKVDFYDFKTGKPENKVKELKEGEAIWRQLVFYKLLSLYGKRFAKQYVMVQGCVDFVQPTEEGEFWQRSVAVTEEACELVREEIRTSWKAIQNLEFDCRSETGSCDWCVKVLRDIEVD